MACEVLVMFSHPFGGASLGSGG